ncbi:hypothetical protein [Streptomyces vietnamensis]|uniref:hypothetical protein n=1 Tax=Streptomyces vietnamensis TaxID=362257 RepID=UPI003F4CC0F9
MSPAPHVARLYAIDPEPGMLAAGARLAIERNITNIEWVNGDSGLGPRSWTLETWILRI